MPFPTYVLGSHSGPIDFRIDPRLFFLTIISKRRCSVCHPPRTFLLGPFTFALSFFFFLRRSNRSLFFCGFAVFRSFSHTSLGFFWLRFQNNFPISHRLAHFFGAIPDLPTTFVPTGSDPYVMFTRYYFFFSKFPFPWSAILFIPVLSVFLLFIFRHTFPKNLCG